IAIVVCLINILSYLRTPELHISIFIRQTTIAIRLTHTHVRGKDGSFARSEEAQFAPSYHLWSKHALVHMQTKWHLIILVTHTQKHRKAMFLLTLAHYSYKEYINTKQLIYNIYSNITL